MLAVQTSIQNTESPHSVGFAPDDEAPYRTISVLSIVGLILGIAAPVAFLAPLLYAIPIVGIAITLLAIRRISLSEDSLIGRKAAVIGLVLSVASISAVFARTALFQELLSRQARVVALDWIGDLQSGDAETAFMLTSASRRSAPSGADGPPDTVSKLSPLDTFRADPVVHFLLDHAKGAPVTFVKDTAFDPATAGNERIQQLFRVGVPAEIGDAATTTLQVMLQRNGGADGASAPWLVAAYSSDDIESNPAEHDHSGHLY